MYFIERRFWSKVAVNFVSVLLPTTHWAFVRGRTPLSQQGSIAPQTRPKHHAAVTSCQYERTEDWEGTLSMTRRRNIRDVQVNRRYGALCARERLRSRRLLQLVSPSWRSRTHSERLGGSTQRATPSGVDSGYRMQHLAKSDSSRSICATPATAFLQHHRDWSVVRLSV